MERILIVDGSNLLFQMFYGMPARIVNSQGRPIHGTIGFLGALLKILRQIQPTHAAVLFDGECTNPRTVLDETYKANREDYSLLPEEETPFSQLPDIFHALQYLRIYFRETECCEADDWIAGLAAQCCAEQELVICSQDSDFFQLIRDNVTVLRYRGDRSVLCDRQWLQEKYGIRPEQYADFKSMTGDKADNIRGAEMIGPKTAAALLKQFGTLDAIIAGYTQITKPSICASIKKNADRLRLNRLLIRLDGTEPVPFTLSEMRYHDSGETSYQVLKAIGLR